MIRALGADASNLRNTMSQHGAILAGALDYDCATFDKNGLCLSFQARYSGSGNMNDGAGVLTGAYSVSPTLRIGGFIDYRVSASNPTGLKFGDQAPIFGGFAKYSEQLDGTGVQTKVAAAINTDRVTVTRSVLDQTEAGSGKASLNSYALAGELGWGFRLDSKMIATPYVGLRYMEATRGAYSEASVAGAVDYPLAYANFHQRLTTGLLGLRLNGALDERIGYQLGAGIEYDFAQQVSHYTGTSSISGLAAFDVNPGVSSIRARATGSAGLYYQIDRTQRLTGSVAVRQPAYGSNAVSSVLLGYQAAF